MLVTLEVKEDGAGAAAQLESGAILEAKVCERTPLSSDLAALPAQVEVADIVGAGHLFNCFAQLRHRCLWLYVYPVEFAADGVTYGEQKRGACLTKTGVLQEASAEQHFG